VGGEASSLSRTPKAYNVRRQAVSANARMAAILVATDIEPAKEFYSEKVGLRSPDMPPPEDGAVFESGGGALLYLYEREDGTKADHTVAGWLVEDLEKTMAELRERGVVFEQVDVPGLKTDERGIAEGGGGRSPWFKDTEGNILAITEL
jgi:predicted enzyme related to lactoylglutathione lyase